MVRGLVADAMIALLAVIFATSALLAAYTYVLCAVWLRYGHAVHGAIWSLFVALARADDRVNADLDELAARRRVA